MSLQPVISSMLIDFDDNDSNMTSQQKAYQKQVYSAIKLNINDLQNYQVVDKFTQCLKCKVVLTDQDKGHVFDFQQIQSNPSNFSKEYVQQLRKNKYNQVLWICGFCGHNNLVSKIDIRFVKNRSRVIERKQSPLKQDPIILIVFDVSGSMQQVIENNQGKKDSSNSNSNSGIKKPTWAHLQKIKQTKIYKKIVQDEKKQLQDLNRTLNNSSNSKQIKNKYVDYLKKNKLLMGLTQHLINKINPSNKKSNMQQSRKVYNDFSGNNNSSSVQKPINSKKSGINGKNKTIGFLFFNSGIMLSLGQNSQKILLCDSNDQYSSTMPGFKKEPVDFDSFQALYKTGQKYGGQYNTKIQNFDFQTLDVKSMSNYAQGQTALGPAIITALGIVSKHGQGSSIVVVTDGISNKGIFDQTQNWQQGFKLLKMRLQKLKCFMTILQFRNKSQPFKQYRISQKQKMLKQEDAYITGIDRFCQKYNDSVVRKINILLNNQKQKSSRQYSNQTSNLQDIEKKMKNGIQRQNSIFSNEVKIKCQHPSVSYTKSMQVLKGKLFDNKQVIHINPQFKQGDLKQRDYLHQFMTQMVIKYQNVKTGEQCIFMSYIIQKFIKYSKIKQKDLKALDNQNTFMNILEYLTAQEQRLDLDNIPLGIIKQTFRKTLCRMPIAQKTLRFPDRKHIEDQSASQWMQNMRKYQDPSYIKQFNTKQTMDTSSKCSGNDKGSKTSIGVKQQIRGQIVTTKNSTSSDTKKQQKQKQSKNNFNSEKENKLTQSIIPQINEDDQDQDYMYL